MPIVRFQVHNSKSLNKVDIALEDINCFIGENGTGKTNILKCLNFFYLSLTEKRFESSLFDKDNPYNDYLEITLTYDLSKIIRIAQNNYDKNFLTVHQFFKKILFDVKSFLDENNKVSVTLRQYKDNVIVWNVPHDFRTFLKNVYPIYFVQARHIKLTDWENLWETIGDMSKLKEKKVSEHQEELINLFEKIYGGSYKKNLNYLIKEFKTNDIEIKKFELQNKLSHIYQLQLGGRHFKYREEELDYYSDGMNSNNYLKILFNLVEKLTFSKLKEPAVVVDEPEVGLHPKLADELMNLIIEKSRVVRVIMATHSSRMVKNIVNTNRASLFHVSNSSKYTIINKMKSFTDNRGTNVISEKEASFYFSRGILFVEGATELELFTNEHLKELFPILNQVEVFSYDSDNVKLRLIHPKERNTAIPHLLLLDLDKILHYENNKFRLKGDSYNPLKNKEIEEKEMYLYGKKRADSLYTRKRIKGIIKKCIFEPNDEWNYIEDDLFHTLKGLIKNYCLQYNVYPVETTIEGALVNKANFPIVYKWINTYKKISHLESTINIEKNPHFKTTILRLILSGKFETLNVIDEKMINRTSDRTLREVYKKINNAKIKKTDGWVGSLINFYFSNYINKDDEQPLSEKLNIFRRHFGELYDIIKKLEYMMK